MKYSHIKRVLTGLILAIFFFWVIFFSNPLMFSLAFSIISCVCLWEFYSMFWQDKRLFFKALGLIVSILILISPFLKINVLFFILFCFWSANLLFLFSFSSGKDIKWRDFQIFSCGILYIPLVFFLLNLLNRKEVFFVLLASFSSDIGAYYFGTWFGKKKLCPKISPNKSWMGSFGGLLCCITLCTLTGLYLASSKWYYFLMASIFLNIAAQLGDLFESALKRSLNTKDSGSLLPGHGGFLDRFDSVLFAIPVFFLIKWFYPLI